MKKTLITLAALAMASVAQAAEPTMDVTDPSGTLTTGYSNTSGDFTMTFVIDWDTAVTELGNWSNKSLTQLGYSDGYWWKNGFKLFRDSSADSDSLYVGFVIDGNDTNPTQGSGASLPGDGANIQYTSADYKVNDKLVLTYSYNSTTDVFTLSALTSDGTLTYATADKAYDIYMQLDRVNLGTPDGVVEQVVAYNSVLSNDEIIANSLALVTLVSPQVPEPTTATLSLLALAGLCARRRRK